MARDDLHHGAMGYGILNGCIGLGAVLAAIWLPRLRRRMSSDVIVSIAAIVFAATLLVMAWVHYWFPLVVALVLGGMAWTGTASSLNIAVQLSVPAWVQARAQCPASDLDLADWVAARVQICSVDGLRFRADLSNLDVQTEPDPRNQRLSFFFNTERQADTSGRVSANFLHLNTSGK